MPSPQPGCLQPVRDLGQNLGPRRGPGGSPMYTKGEREGILWEFHRSGMGVKEACRRLPLLPNHTNLYRWLRMEVAGELVATEMPGRLGRMHCAHGEGSVAYAGRRPRGGRIPSTGTAGGGPGWPTSRGSRGRRTGATGGVPIVLSTGLVPRLIGRRESSAQPSSPRGFGIRLFPAAR